MKIPDGTGFKIILAEDIPDSADKDQVLRFTASEDVRVGENLVVAKGAAVTGAIVDPGKRRFIGLPVGKMTLKLTAVDAVVMVIGTPTTVKARVLVATSAGTAESVTVNPRVEVEAPTGVPVMAPVAAFKTRPVGRCPAVIVQVRVPTPPVAAKVLE